ncbi:diguanylate cyclase [Streptomyces sp. 150FB]|uniref:PAS domain-containing protein n=1 Tax=Streptomyces sp. 150FB TaxID=1576605 RepID=UPI00058910B5|nr:PAS domain-containing protein [Streptomyces sp. 150FB]KIF74989.1 diguanylate cyclase [Streptomyces sp. 150FB]
MSASRSETTSAPGPDEPEPVTPSEAEREGPGSDLLAALLDGMDAALCAFDADGAITHWNREAERILGWSAGEAVGRMGFAGWAVRTADAGEVHARLMAAMGAPGRQVHEFALLRKDGGRVLVRTQSAGVRGTDGKPAGVYCAFSEVHAQIDLERSIALSEALFEDASWGVVLVDVDLRPTVVNAYAARALGSGRTTVLGRPLGELVVQGVDEIEAAFHHVLAEGAPRALAELWVTVRTAEGERRRCWRSGFLRLASPLAEEPVPLGVGWLFTDVTEAKLAVLEADRSRFRSTQSHRAARAAAECEDPMEAATVHLDFALAGFADHALIDLVVPERQDVVRSSRLDLPVRLVRAAATPSGGSGPSMQVAAGGIPVRYMDGHPALQAMDRTGAVRASAPVDGSSRSGVPGSGPRGGAGSSHGGGGASPSPTWAVSRQWPADSVHALCTVLRNRGRSLGVVTFLRGPGRPAFERQDAVYAEDVTLRMAASLDLSGLLADRSSAG